MPERKQSTASKAFEAALAAELRALMARKRITQAEIGDAFDYSQSWLSKRLNGVVPWDILDLLNVCDYLNADASEVIATAKRAALKLVPPEPGEPGETTAPKSTHSDRSAGTT